MSWDITFRCDDCGKRVSFRVEDPTFAATGRDNRAFETSFRQFSLPPEAQFFSTDSTRCYDCGKSRWEAGYAQTRKKQSEEFEALVSQYAELAKNDPKALGRMIAKSYEAGTYDGIRLRAVAEALQRSAA